MCDRLFTATSHPLSEFIFFLNNHCQQLSNMVNVNIMHELASTSLALLCPLASYKLQYLAILKSRAEHLFEVINSRDDVLRTLMGRCTYLRYVETGLTDRVLYADEILKYGFCLNVIKTSLCPLEVLKNVQEAV
ncbi:hypothetical protein Bca4012_042403 [Brassica carinata]